MKYNPFKPNSIVSPGMFAGRIEEIEAVEQCLFQARHSNPQHFLILGERGIGKSSLLFYVELVAKGDIPADEVSFSYLTISLDLGGAQTQLDIIQAIGRQLRSVLRQSDKAKELARDVWSWLTNWEVLGVRFHKDLGISDPQDYFSELVDRIEDLSTQISTEYDGILVLIDEADRPPEDADLGEFLKNFTERLSKRNCKNVLFGLAGLPLVLSKLRASHESSPRLFETLQLEPLELEERKRVINAGITEANSINTDEIKITNDALDMISNLSEGYPHFVQQFSYSAFSEDQDNVIDSEDVRRGAFKENGALAQLGQKYFNEMYHTKISSDDYRRVLDTMSLHGDKWMSRRDIIRESGLEESKVNNALMSLKNKNIILVDESRRGFYRLPTKSFAVWINAIKIIGRGGEGEGDNLFEI